MWSIVECVFEKPQRSQRETRGAAVIYFWIASNIKKKRSSNGKSTGGGCCSKERGGGGQPAVLHVRHLNKLLWHEGRLLWLIKKCWFLSLHSPAAAAITGSHSTTQTKLHRVRRVCVCDVRCSRQTKWLQSGCSWIGSSPGRQKNRGTCPQSFFWKLSYFVAPQETQWVKSLVAWLFLRQGASAGDFKQWLKENKYCCWNCQRFTRIVFPPP